MHSHFLSTYKIVLKCNNPEIEVANRSTLSEVLGAYFEREETTANVLDKYLVLEQFEKETNLFQGKIKAGTHGITGELTNTETGMTKAEQTIKDALLHPYFFRIHCYSRTNAILVLQKIGIAGIKTAFEMSVKDFVSNKYHDYSIEMHMQIQNSVAKKFFRDAKARSVKIRVQTCPPELSEGLSDDRERERYEKKFSAIIELKPDQFVDKWLNGYEKTLSQPGVMTIYGQEVNWVKIQCELNGKHRIFRMDDILATGIDLEIENIYIDPLTGHPYYDKIKSEAKQLSKSMLESILNVPKI